MSWRVPVAAALLVSSAHGQTPPRSPVHVVSGVVFDSVVSAPLAGAVVQIAPVDSALQAAAVNEGRRVFWTTADSVGHFRITGLPAGRFAIGFQHDALNALGLESPLRGFELGADTSVVMDLAIPSGAVVRAQRCGTTGGAQDGMLAGYILDANHGNTLTGAAVMVSWIEISLQRGDFHTDPNGVAAIVGEDGTYLLCGVATDAPVGIHVTRQGYRGIVGEISVPVGGTARRDFRLVDSTLVRGTATLAGRVVHANGAAVTTGRVLIDALAIDAPVRDGEFSMSEIPAGTWVVEARAIGYEPHSMLLDLADRTSASTTITLTRRAQMLDAVSIVGKAGGDVKVLDDILKRARTSFGTVFLPGHDALKAALTPADVLRSARGFTYLSSDTVRARGCGIRSGNKKLLVYLDGLRYPQGLEELKNMVPMRDLLAVEAYPDAISTPLLYRTSDACAVIAVWTKR